MSSQNPHGSLPPDHDAGDAIAFGKVIAVGVISLVVFALATTWAVTIFHHERARAHAQTGFPQTAHIGAPEIGIVDQVLFEGDLRLKTWQAARTARLEGYGWVDRSKGIVHIPIEQAMGEVISGALPDGAPK